MCAAKFMYGESYKNQLDQDWKKKWACNANIAFN